MYRFLIILLISKIGGDCPANTIEWHSNCFSFLSSSTGFEDAEISCKIIGGNLAAIHDGFVNALLAQEAAKRFNNESAQTNFWIGATNLLKPPTWNWIDGTSVDFTEWKKGEPQNITGSNCVALSITDGSWTTEDCYMSKPYVCSFSSDPLPTILPPYANCSAGWIYFEPTQSCFGGIGWNEGNWTNAENQCIQLGGHLPSIHSYEELNFVFTMEYTFGGYFWIGLFTEDNGNTWQWSDNSPVDYTIWNVSPPNNIPGRSCVYIGYLNATTPIFVNDECDDNGYSTCQKKFVT